MDVHPIRISKLRLGINTYTNISGKNPETPFK
jgi:hypothetical protein